MPEKLAKYEKKMDETDINEEINENLIKLRPDLYGSNAVSRSKKQQNSAFILDWHKSTC